MSRSNQSETATPVHGAAALPSVTVRDYNAELREGDAFIGDRANKRAFRAMVEQSREKLRAIAADPFGDTAPADLTKKALDAALLSGTPEAGGIVLAAIEAFAHELAAVARHLMLTPGWRGVERIAVGGGMRASRYGELAIGRASILLRTEGLPALQPIHHHPDEAGLVGSAFLVPSEMLAEYQGLLAIDIGGSNMRVGVVELNQKQAPDLCAARVMGLDIWRHGDEEPGRDDAIERLCGMVRDVHRGARKDGVRLAPLIGVGCPGAIGPDGTIARGAQNLPGQWEGADFNLPECLRAALPEICGSPTRVLMHNDAVIQGLSEVPRMQDTARWGILTVGTGLGNASFANHCGR